jgi:2-oxo-4-hydroxy-4-carboxy-5-ureidoimidazoline decarboxylase
MSMVLSQWNNADEATALEAMLSCCGARRWASAMVASRPINDIANLRETADILWRTMEVTDWMEAFSCHPRIGDRAATRASAMSQEWSRGEQSSVASAPDRVLTELAAGNVEYENRFGFTYIVCATGKSAEEMLTILQKRLSNSRVAELHEAAEQQRQITQIRLRKWLGA